MERKRILIVDDSEVDRELMKRVIGSKSECEAIGAIDGQECLRFIKEQRFDLIIMDIMMPGDLGTKVLTQVREKYNQIELPIIMVTSLETASTVVSSLKMGANDYIVKPVNVEIAMARIRTHLKLAELSRKMTRVNELMTLTSAVAGCIQQLGGLFDSEDSNRLDMAASRLTAALEEIKDIAEKKTAA